MHFFPYSLADAKGLNTRHMYAGMRVDLFLVYVLRDHSIIGSLSTRRF